MFVFVPEIDYYFADHVRHLLSARVFGRLGQLRSVLFPSSVFYTCTSARLVAVSVTPRLNYYNSCSLGSGDLPAEQIA